MAESFRGNVSDFIGRILFTIYEFEYHSVDYINLARNIYPVVLEYLVAVLAALLPIYTGSWASLKRPSSARRLPEPPEGEDEYEPEDEFEALGFVPLDIIRVPLFAGAALTGMYYLIKYLDDPELISKVLSAYFAFAGIYSVTFFVSDAIRAAHKLVFPSYFARGSKEVWFVDGQNRTAKLVFNNGERTAELQKDTPLPGILSALKLPSWLRDVLWNARQFLLQKFLIKFSIHRVVADKTVMDVIDLIGIASAFVVIAAYLTLGRPWYLTNLLGISFSYFAVQQMSPTSFKLASAVMTGLLVYDVVMVFYTPMMVTVATKLDIPAKLTFPRPSATPGQSEFSILGLGDIVLPGIVISLALRFDLHMAYIKKQRQETLRFKASAVQTKYSDQIQNSVAEYAPYYVPYYAHWHNLWWTRKAAPAGSQSLPALWRFDFPTPYFTAALISYPLAMIVCWVVMSIYHHGQPALFYLVPSLLLSIWLTAWWRGEVKDVWAFHEELAEEEPKDEKKEALESTQETEDGKTKTTIMPRHSPRNVANAVNEESTHNGPVLDQSSSSVEPDGKIGGNVLRLENKLKQSADLDLVYFGISTRAPKPEKPMSSLLDENAVLEAYGLQVGSQVHMGNDLGAKEAIQDILSKDSEPAKKKLRST